MSLNNANVIRNGWRILLALMVITMAIGASTGAAAAHTSVDHCGDRAEAEYESIDDDTYGTFISQYGITSFVGTVLFGNSHKCPMY